MTDELDSIQRALGRIEGRLGEMAESLRVRHKHDDERHDAIEKRVRKVETRQAWYAGAAAVISASVTAIASAVLPGFFKGGGA